ncbi:hypothetical protein ABZY44_20725 [Streptomyces sp. NPDC006544]|uniref:hypothetical protein n=1 Tax=Streptomyces sp. NPDC006544 TaxID=3154583 RepID=UPI0033B7A6A4
MKWPDDAVVGADAHLPDGPGDAVAPWSCTGQERHTYAIVARLLPDPASRDRGAEIARAACHTWRAAPVRLLPLLVLHGGPEPSPAVTDALVTASISEQATRAHGDLLATVGLTSYPRPRGTRRAGRPSYDGTSAAELLSAKPLGIGRLNHAPEIFGALLDEGPLTFRQAAQLYNLTFRWPGRMQGVCAPLWLRHAGPRALPRLLELMTPYLHDYAVGEYYLEGLARMGHQARPVLPAVTAMIERRTRIPVNDSTPDGEMRLDENLLKAALATRHAILADGGAP